MCFNKTEKNSAKKKNVRLNYSDKSSDVLDNWGDSRLSDE